MRRFLPLVLILACFLGDAWAWLQFREHAGESHQTSALWLHCVLAAAAAIVGCFIIQRATLGTRITLVVLYFIIAAILPVAGILVVLCLGWTLNSPAGTGEHPEAKYVFGNPQAIAARRETRQVQPVLSPLGEIMRSFNGLELEKMIHGLRYLTPSRLTLHFLRRFQTDPASNLQFASQGVITANLERLESQHKTITARLAATPQDVAAHMAAAEILLELAAWTPEGDATAQVYRSDSLRHLANVLKQQPKCAHALQLQAKAYVGLEECPAAAQTLAQINDPTLKNARLLAQMEVDVRAGNYTQLTTLSQQLTTVPEEAAEAIGFWSGSIEPPLALGSKR